jgi:hypothetical protein
VARSSPLRLTTSSRTPAAPHEPAATIGLLSHHAAFAVQMRRAGLDVREGRDVDELSVLASEVDLLVVDLVAIEHRRGLVARLSTSVDAHVPLVLVSADEVDVALLGPGRSVHVVVPPVRADDVVACVRRVLSEELKAHRQAAVAAPAAKVKADRGAVVRKVDLRAVGPTERATSGSPSKAVVADLPATSAPPVAMAPPTAVGLPTGGAASAATGTGVPAPDPDATQPMDAAPTTVAAALPAWRGLADQLLVSVRGVRSLPAAAQALAEEIAEAGDVDVAVLVRDESGCWRVEGGVGLRTFEWGQSAEDTDWIVVTGRQRHATLVVGDTDAVRGDIIGMPLASRRQLVRTHSTRADFMACAGWPERGDDKERVSRVSSSVKRHESTVADALELRTLVRTLARQAEGIDSFLSR